MLRQKYVDGNCHDKFWYSEISQRISYYGSSFVFCTLLRASFELEDLPLALER